MLLKWVLSALAVMLTAWIVPGITVANFPTALIVSITIGIINIFVKPILLFITLPINILTLGVFTLVVNALLLMLAGYLIPGFNVNGFWSAFFGAIVLSLLTVIVNLIAN